MFSTYANATDAIVDAASHDATRHEPPASTVATANSRPTAIQRGTITGTNAADGREDQRQEGQGACSMPDADGHDTVGQVERVGVGIGGLDPCAAADEVDQPRERGEPDETGEVTPTQHARHQRGPDVDDHAGDAGPVDREHRGESPGTDRTDEIQPDRRRPSGAAPSGTA